MSKFPALIDLPRALRDARDRFETDTDDLVELANRFIEFKRHLGHRYDVVARRLMAFLRFLHEKGIQKATQLTIGLLTEYSKANSHVQASTWNGGLSAISVFWDHLNALGRAPGNPCAIFSRRSTPDRIVPYIFAPEQLRAIFKPPNASAERKRRSLVYLVIYACGLRVGEAGRFNMEHFDPAQGTLFILRSKWAKDRLVALHPRIVSLLEDYRREFRAQAKLEDPLFVDTLGQSFRKPRDLTKFFHKDLVRLGLYRKTHESDGLRILSPRVHSLRHTFAVNRLLKWYRQGRNVQDMLPFLSTYLGHADVRNTQVYLKATRKLLEEGHHRFRKYWEPKFPLAP